MVFHHQECWIGLSKLISMPYVRSSEPAKDNLCSAFDQLRSPFCERLHLLHVCISHRAVLAFQGQGVYVLAHS